MIHDARVEVTCDGGGCSESIEIEPDFVYPDYSGKNGRYNTDAAAIEEKLDGEGWTVIEGDENKHLCEGCGEEETP